MTKIAANRRWNACRVVAVACLLGVAPGCTVWKSLRRTTVGEPDQFSWKCDREESLAVYRQWAEQAWRDYAGGGCDNGGYDGDFGAGFRDGFVDFVYAGGNGEPPPVPPRYFWNVEVRGPAGHDRVRQWFDGYREGAAFARVNGYRERAIVPSSYLLGGADDPPWPPSPNASAQLPPMGEPMLAAPSPRQDESLPAPAEADGRESDGEAIEAAPHASAQQEQDGRLPKPAESPAADGEPKLSSPSTKSAAEQDAKGDAPVPGEGVPAEEIPAQDAPPAPALPELPPAEEESPPPADTPAPTEPSLEELFKEGTSTTAAPGARRYAANGPEWRRPKSAALKPLGVNGSSKSRPARDGEKPVEPLQLASSEEPEANVRRGSTGISPSPSKPAVGAAAPRVSSPKSAKVSAGKAAAVDKAVLFARFEPNVNGAPPSRDARAQPVAPSKSSSPQNLTPTQPSAAADGTARPALPTVADEQPNILRSPRTLR